MWIKSKGIKMIINKKDIDFSNYSISAYKDLLDKIDFDYKDKLLLFRIKRDSLSFRVIPTYNEVFFNKADESNFFKNLVNQTILINDFDGDLLCHSSNSYKFSLLDHNKYRTVRDSIKKMRENGITDEMRRYLLDLNWSGANLFKEDTIELFFSKDPEIFKNGRYVEAKSGRHCGTMWRNASICDSINNVIYDKIYNLAI